MIGTIRSLDAKMRDDIHARIKRTAEDIARSGGATATVTITDRLPDHLQRSRAHRDRWPRRSAASPAPRTSQVVNAVLGAEDFSFFQQKVPGLFFWLGTRPKNKTAEEAASNHSPLFYVDESGLELGVRAMAHVAVDYLKTP